MWEVRIDGYKLVENSEDKWDVSSMKISINPIFQEHPSEMLWPATAGTSCKVGFATEQTEKGLLVWQRSVSLSLYIYIIHNIIHIQLYICITHTNIPISWQISV